jgi:hypothetical protein
MTAFPYDWQQAVPDGFEHEVVPPWTFRQHEDEEALATKLIGLDRVERLDSCRPRVQNHPAVLTREEDLGL